jgi:hypothetical protein
MPCHDTVALLPDTLNSPIHIIEDTLITIQEASIDMIFKPLVTIVMTAILIVVVAKFVVTISP